MKKFWQKLKKRWGIESDWQVAVILVVFSLTGFSFLPVHRYINQILGITPEDPFWIKLIVFVIILLPLYNLLLLIWGTILGQGKFFRRFIIRFFSRILFIKSRK